MSPDTFRRFYSDDRLRQYVADMARRLSPTREAAEDAEQEAWLVVAQAPDNVAPEGLRQAVTMSVASAVYQSHTRPSKCSKLWIRVLRDYLGNDGLMMYVKDMLLDRVGGVR